MTPVSTEPRRNHMEPLWDRVDANRMKLTGLVALFVVGSALGVDLWASIPVAIVSARQAQSVAAFGPIFWRNLGFVTVIVAIAAVVWATLTLLRSEKWLLRRFDATLVPQGELLETKFALKDMAIAGGLPVAPALYLMPGWTTNAFIFAARRRRAVIGVTEGFLRNLSVDEQRAVFANLVARLISGETILTTGFAALMWPVQSWRTHRLSENLKLPQLPLDDPIIGAAAQDEEVMRGAGIALLFGIGFAVMAEVAAAGQRYAQLSSAEKADAEGMLLLKDPQTMLSALRRCIALDNAVPAAGETLSELFYCWTGFASDDDEDPEWNRVARLREVLGVMGHDTEVPVRLDEIIPPAPVAPWLEERDGTGRG